MVTSVLDLSKLQIKNIFNVLLRRPAPEPPDKLLPADVWYLLLADLLQRVKFLKPEQQAILITQIQLPGTAHLVFADATHCTWTGRTGFLSLETGDTAELQHPPLETIGYNLEELYRRGVLKIANRAGLNAKHNAGSVDESGDIRDRTVDDVS